MNDFDREISAAVRDYMRAHGVTQQNVADHLGRSQSYVSDRLGSRLDVTVDILGAVAELTGRSPRLLLLTLTEAMMLATDAGQSPSGTPPE